jgi:hypothetical protein
VDLEDLLDSAVYIVLTWRFAVEDLDRESPTRNGVGSGVTEEGRELCTSLDINGTRLELTFSAFMVADVTMSFKSLRRDRTGQMISWGVDFSF